MRGVGDGPRALVRSASAEVALDGQNQFVLLCHTY
jgi:hypothetical protein